MVRPLGIKITVNSGSWEAVERYMHSNPTLFGWGSLDPMELYHHYASRLGGAGYFNPGYYANPQVDKTLQQAISAPNWQAAIPFWQKVDWDGNSGAGVRGDAAWVWLLNLNHTYLVNPCVSLSQGAPEAHGDWTILNNMQDWIWTCK